PRQLARLARFYAHESCAQCTQCREGTAWMTRILERIVDGHGTFEDLDTIFDLASLTKPIATATAVMQLVGGAVAVGLLKVLFDSRN
ncbi:MAG: hypothetical protein EBX99_11760, partial [Acidimicrobiia bacterium]|nr:hypothetical protein [Acidimicrobiia bacterium]